MIEYYNKNDVETTKKWIELALFFFELCSQTEKLRAKSLENHSKLLRLFSECFLLENDFDRAINTVNLANNVKKIIKK